MALIAGLKAPSELIAGKSFNVGIMNGNYSIKKLATTVQNIIPDCDIQFTNEENDPRTYKVSFNKILNELKDFYKPTMSLVEGAHELIDFFKEINFTKDQFLGSQTNRIKKIEELMINNVINNKLQIR